jgi:hypothetical protein
MRLLARCAAALVLAAGAATVACSRDEPTTAAPAAEQWFTDVATASGLAFTHANGMTGAYLDHEIFPPGVGLIDYDNDGDLDVYAVQSVGGDRLFRNDLAAGVLRFTDVTTASGIDVRSYGMGVAAGDINNDGFVDVYLTRLGPNVMLLNDGDGTFTDVSRKSGTDDPSWSVSAAFVDFDRDGWLDLFVGNYLAFSVEGDVKCFGWSGEADYCAPASYRAQRSRLYRNRGDGTFADVTAAALLGGEFGPALGVATADYDGDGWMDIYVANDGQENQLWTNQRNGTFRNTALLAGAALTVDGRTEASMGVDAGDVDNDGDEDIVIANLTSEGTTLYLNDGRGVFEDAGTRSGLRQRSVAYTGFGNAWADFDNDGWLDLLTVNGAVRRIDTRGSASDPFPYRQAKQVFRNTGNGRFEDVTASAGSVLQAPEVSRGAAFGDVDNDGDTDVVIGNNSGPMRLLLNNVGSRSQWLGVRVIGAGGRDMLGARVGVVRGDGSTLWRRARADGSYASANDPRVLVGLASTDAVARVRVAWPDGTAEEWTDVAVGRWTTLVQGTAK